MKNKERLGQKIVRYRHQQLLHSHYGYNIDEVSRQNLHKLRQSLSRLSAAEITIVEKLIASFTLKHATNAAKEILETGKMCSVRALEKEGNLVVSHSSGKDGHDQSIFFVFGIGDHKTPKFIESATHEVTIDLYKLFQKKPSAGRQLWVSSHLDEFLCERTYMYTIGEVEFKIDHSKEHIKTYSITYPDGTTNHFQTHYQDEIFTGYDVLAGISLKFIQLLRMLGGRDNAVINQLYDNAETNTEQFMPLLESLFSSLMPGDVYPEAKVINELPIDQEYFQIKSRKTPDYPEWKYNAVIAALENFNVKNLIILLQRGYPCYHPHKNIIEHLLTLRYPSKDIKYKLFNLIFQYYYDPDPSCMSLKSAIMFAAGEEGRAEDLDFLLSQKIKHSPSSGICYSPNVKFEQMHDGKPYNLISLVCTNDCETTEKLSVLQRHGADFKTYAFYYYRDALMTNHHMERPNTEALLYLEQLGVRPVSSEPTYNETPLMLACKTGRIDLVRFFVEMLKVEINEPLAFKKISGFFGFTSYIDPTNGKTALDFAIESGATDVIEYLKKQGAQLGKCSEQPQGKNENTLYRVVPLLKGIRADNKPYVVLGKRQASDRTTILTNAYCFPGGEVDATDENIETAVLRELYEETSVDVRKIPDVKITQLASIDGFSDPAHKATVFFLIDVGAYPIAVEASDDFYDARRVTVDQLTCTEGSVAKYMTVDDTRVLGSNALLIQHCVLEGLTELSPPKLEQLKQQVLLEAQGNDHLCQVIKENPTDIFPGSKTWIAVESLLENLAHLGYKYFPVESLALLMLLTNGFEGIELLKKHQVDVTGTGVLSLGSEQFTGTALEYAFKLNQLPLAKRLIDLEPKLISLRPDRHNALLIQCVHNGSYEGIDLLLGLGVNPNTSNDNEVGRQIQLPVIGTAVKNATVDLVTRLLSDRRIFLNREHSFGDKNTPLMTAIKHDKKDMAFVLLADGRLDLSMKNKAKKTALLMAQEKSGWEDVVALILDGLEKQSQPNFRNSLLKNTQKTVDSTYASEIISNPGFYHQLIQECSSLEEVHFDFGSSSIDELMALITHTRQQDSIHTVYFAYQIEGDLGLLPMGLDTAQSFKSLKHVHCTNMPLIQLKTILGTELQGLQSITIHGVYSQADIDDLVHFLTMIKMQVEVVLVDMDMQVQRQIDLAITQNQMERLNVQYDASCYKSTVNLDYSAKPESNLQDKLQIMNRAASSIQITQEFYEHNLSYIKRFFSEHKNLVSVTMFGFWDAESSARFLTLLSEQTDLQHLSLGRVQIADEGLALLSTIMSRNPIQALNLNYSTFLVPHEPLSKAISQHKHLVFLSCKELESIHKMLPGIIENQTLLAVGGWETRLDFRKIGADINRVIVRNATLRSPPSYSATESDRLFKGASHEDSKVAATKVTELLERVAGYH